MFEILQFGFMQRALLVGFLIALIIPMIGQVVVLKRLSMVGDALGHASLSGVAIGLLLGFNPLLGAIFASVIAALSIEIITKKIRKYHELAIAIVTSAGVGLAAILSGFISNGNSFNAFLFGSIVTVSTFEVYLISIVAIVVIISYVILYKSLFYISFNEQQAKLANIPVQRVNFIFTILSALTISIAARSIGALIVSSLLVVPVACALQISKGYFDNLIKSIILSVMFVIVGLFLSYYLSLRPGGTIVLLGVITFIIILIVKKIKVSN